PTPRMLPPADQGRRFRDEPDHDPRRQREQGPSDYAAKRGQVDLARHVERARALHQRDLAAGAGWVELPWALGRKYPHAGREWAWQWVFPATRLYVDPSTGQRRRHHLHESVVQRAVREAVLKAGLAKKATCHTFRH